MTEHSTPTMFSHIGICVSDLERSSAFYKEALGCTVSDRSTVSQTVAKAVEIDGEMVLHNRYLRHGSMMIELLQFDKPAAEGEVGRRPINRFGFTHLSFRVDDVGEVAARIAAAGGTALEHTRLAFDVTDGTERFEMMFCTDPDGTRIELMDLPPSMVKRLYG